MPRNYFTQREIEGVQAARRFILAHLHRPPTVKRVAREAGLSVGRLEEGFRHFYESGVATFILETRLQLGHFLLVHTDMPIKEIALTTGYKYRKNFTAAYRRFFGVAPSYVRNVHDN